MKKSKIRFIYLATLGTLATLLLIGIISILNKDTNLADNNIIINVTVMLRLISYVLGSIGAFSIIFAVLQYRQSQNEIRREDVKASFALIKYFMKNINVPLKNINNSINKRYLYNKKSIINRLRKEYGNDVKLPYKIDYDYISLSSKKHVLSMDSSINVLNKLEYWADYVNESAQYGFVEESIIYNELNPLTDIVNQYRVALIDNKQLRYYKACNRLFNRWTLWHNKHVKGGLNDD